LEYGKAEQYRQDGVCAAQRFAHGFPVLFTMNETRIQESLQRAFLYVGFLYIWPKIQEGNS